MKKIRVIFLSVAIVGASAISAHWIQLIIWENQACWVDSSTSLARDKESMSKEEFSRLCKRERENRKFEL